jgi:hypothetical protein
MFQYGHNTLTPSYTLTPQSFNEEAVEYNRQAMLEAITDLQVLAYLATTPQERGSCLTALKHAEATIQAAVNYLFVVHDVREAEG